MIVLYHKNYYKWLMFTKTVSEVIGGVYAPRGGRKVLTFVNHLEGLIIFMTEAQCSQCIILP